MILSLPYDNLTLSLEAPENIAVYSTSFPKPQNSSENVVMDALKHPHESPSLIQSLKNRRKGDVVIVVSDITRPIPYSKFLMSVLSEIESAGVEKEEILILIATGMHRPSSNEERIFMFGEEINDRYRIIDHIAEREEDLATIPGKSWAGKVIRLNRRFVEAGFRIVTGLVEPHFMAGFSGGRKSVCPGLSSLETLQKFHGYEFLSHPLAKNGMLNGNPCHEEAVSMARLCGIDISLNVILNKKREVVKAFAGEIEAAHIAACEFVKKYACPPVSRECDVVVTSSGGYPLDATFYQCVKGLVSCLPTVKKGGTIISIGGCREGIGSSEYRELMFRYSGDWRAFLEDIKTSEIVLKDQWEFQMHTRVLEKVGKYNLYFITDGISGKEMQKIYINPIPVTRDQAEKTVQELLNKMLTEGKTLAVIPEGPYCAPL